MNNRLSDAELDRLEMLRKNNPSGPMSWNADSISRNPGYGPDATTIRSADGRIRATMDYDIDGAKMADMLASAYNALPALLAELREHRAREATTLHPGRLAIVDGFLVQMSDEHTCAGSSTEWPYAHEPHCGMEPLQRLDDLPGWPGEESNDG